MNPNNENLDQQISDSQRTLDQIFAEVSKVVVGQNNLIRNLLIAILSGGHTILEGVPGLAKTLSIQTLSKTLDLSFSRIQFTPDLLPSDLIGTKIFDQNSRDFFVKKGPIFANFILADEINRAPSKVQSALLEAMEEKQVTIGEETFPLELPFTVLATQNPIEQEGTYTLPEAQLDRFLLKTVIGYPTPEEEIEIMKKNTGDASPDIQTVLTSKDIFKLRDLGQQIFVSDNIYQYVKDLIFCSRSPDQYGLANLKKYLSFGGSPRASIALIKCAKILAMMNGRSFVIPEDIKEIAPDVLRHRIIPSYEAIAEDISADDIVQKILNNVKVI